ncbi:MAG: histidine phosphatase family protein [Microbacterium sp.]|nr:histidine phosphatase family protein [Microbacterium sp.]
MPEITRRTALLALGSTALAGAAAGTAAPAVAAPKGGAGKGGAGKAVTVYLVRHGQTWLNLTGRVQGWSDSPLTAQGIETASAVGRNLAAEIGGFDAAYSADTVRHFQTATGILEAAGSRLSPTRVFGLREAAYGGWEGEKQSAALPAMLPYLPDPQHPFDATLAQIMDAFVRSNPKPELPAETHAQVAARMLDALTAAASDRTMPRRYGGTILAVSSGMSTIALLESLGASVEGELHNGAVNKLVYAQGAWAVEWVNNTDYAH